VRSAHFYSSEFGKTDAFAGAEKTLAIFAVAALTKAI
jgi:hypothetical protein